MDQAKIKQQVVDKLKQAEKVLVTVSKNPSVDELSAALGLTLLLDAQGKYATAIFSGETPPALAFLEPEKTFDDTTDSLRDFIIALNKEKADHLRYKVVDDSVKIFITPYKTTITEEDLEFSQGDYNVELVVAIGVDDQQDLDAALDNHGQILHDAAIITVSAGDQTSSLGGIDWSDPAASSLSEMIASLAEPLKTDRKKQNLTAPIATALLTGIVAQTERFSNERTTSRAMTIAATLMSAGADQQLIANELASAENVIESEPEAVDSITDDASSSTADSKPESTVDANGGLSIKHEDPPVVTPEPTTPEAETLAELDSRVRGQEDAIIEEAKSAAAIPAHGPQPEVAPQVEPKPEPQPESEIEEPLFGGVLNASIAQAENDAANLADSGQNQTILSHKLLPSAPEVDVSSQDIQPSLDDSQAVSSLAEAASAYASPGEKIIEPLPHDVQSTPQVEPAINLPMPPPIPDFSQLGVGDVPPMAQGPALPLPPSEPAQILGDILNNPADSPVEQVASAYGAYSDDNVAVPVSQSATVPLPEVQQVNSAYSFDGDLAQPISSDLPQIEPATSQEVSQTSQLSGAYAMGSSDPGQFQIPAPK